MVKAERNLLDFMAYATLFPQLVAGPIVRYADISQQLHERTHSLSGAYLGSRRFLVGLGKKVLFANSFGMLCSQFDASRDHSVLFYWLYAVAYTLQIYYDFSGYSDMAIGLGKIFGFEFIPNFNYPYISKSITEFWRRWHISLSTWFRDYVYIPLGRESGFPTQADPELIDCMDAHRAMAWGSLEFRALGVVFCPFADPGEVYIIQVEMVR